MKKLIASILVLSLLISTTTTLFATDEFSDVTGNEWFYNDLIELSSTGIIAGTGSGLFEPNKLLTKDALIKTLVVAEGFALENDPTYWAQNFINKALELGWLEGIDQTAYNVSINRYESCLLIVNAIGDYSYPDNLQSYSRSIADYDQIPAEYQEVVLKVYALGIITGYTDGTFGGSNTLRRSEMTAILSRYIVPSNRKTPISPESASKLSQITDKESIDSELVTITDGKILYTDDTTGNQIPITSSKLRPDLGRLSEDIFINTAFAIQNQGLTLQTSYNAGRYYMALIKDTTLPASEDQLGDQFVEDGTDTGDLEVLLTYEVLDGEDKVSVTLPDIAREPQLDLEPITDTVLELIINEIDSTQAAEIKSFISGQYLIIDTDADYSRLKTFGSINVKIVADAWEYKVEFWIYE